MDDGAVITLEAGDFLNIPAHCRNRVVWTDPDQETIWLAVFYTDDSKKDSTAELAGLSTRQETDGAGSAASKLPLGREKRRPPTAGLTHSPRPSPPKGCARLGGSERPPRRRGSSYASGAPITASTLLLVIEWYVGRASA